MIKPAGLPNYWIVGIVFLSSLSGCQLWAQANNPASTTPGPVLMDTSQAQAQFARFLSLAVATRVPHLGMMDSVYSCNDTEGRHDMKWISDARVLFVTTRGDSGRAAAVLTTVAHQVETDDGYYARYRLREDTAHWELVRNARTNGLWMVCGDALEGFGITHIGRTIRWVEGSRAKALAAIDSIRQARGLQTVR